LERASSNHPLSGWSVIIYEKIVLTFLIISDFGEGSDTHPKKLKHIGCVASYRDIGNGLAVQLGF
jgi:hypothetical protein